MDEVKVCAGLYTELVLRQLCLAYRRSAAASSVILVCRYRFALSAEDVEVLQCALTPVVEEGPEVGCMLTVCITMHSVRTTALIARRAHRI